ncbi:MAG: hypothetical protein DI538_10130 [Azospira oryzae]|nr:MAG: hypothetical protein DI538_10130 [Azospira oryzae]
MGNAMKRRHNIFEDMTEVHIQLVFDELTDRFGFPEKAWKTFWKEHLAKQPKSADDIGVFLHFGYHHINPIINSILLRREGLNTFNNLCEYIIKRENEKKFRKK